MKIDIWFELSLQLENDFIQKSLILSLFRYDSNTSDLVINHNISRF
jgi:hypothetical protein